MKKMNIFYFDNDVGDFDKYNPRFVMEQRYVKEAITVLSKKQAYHFNIESLAKKIGVNDQIIKRVISFLHNVSAVEENEGRLRLNFPFFRNKDIKYIKKVINNNLLKNYFK